MTYPQAANQELQLWRSLRRPFALLLSLVMLLALTTTAGAAPPFEDVATFAGTGTGDAGGDGAATSSALHSPYTLAHDTAGNAYIADSINHRIQKVDTGGNVTTLAGTGTLGTGGDGVATGSALNRPVGVVPDNNGNVYIADSENHRVQKVDTDGNVSTFAGTGTLGAGADGPATSSALNRPTGLFLDAAGNLYITDTNNHRVRRVDTNGNITTVAGTGTLGPGGDGLATGSALHYPVDIALDLAGNLYIADGQNHRVQKVDTDGNVTTVAGTGAFGAGGDGPATGSALNWPYGVEVDSAGYLYIADSYNHRIQQVDLDGNVSTIAGTGITGAGGDGPATGSALDFPSGISLDSHRNVYIADTNNHRIQLVTVIADTTDPTVNITSSDAPYEFACTDVGRAGLASCIGTVSDDSLSVTATDHDGNTTTQTTAITAANPGSTSGLKPIRVGNPYRFNRFCKDLVGANPDTCVATLNNKSITDGHILASRGTQTLTVTATDAQGNTTTRTMTFTTSGKRELTGSHLLANGISGSIARLYMAAFTRNPESTGFLYWENRYDNGMTLSQIAHHFANGAESQSLYQDTSNTEFVELMYVNVLGRASEPSGHGFWVARLDGGMSRDRLLLLFSESTEFRVITRTS